MRGSIGWCLGLLLWVAPLLAAEPQGKLVKETWDAAYLERSKVGYYHTAIRELERDGQKFLRTTVDLSLTIKRYNATARLRLETGSDETPGGKVLGVVMRQYQGDEAQLVLTGVVEGEQLHLKDGKGRVDKRIPWNAQVIGLYRQERIFQEHKVKPGDEFSYQSYEPTIASVVTMHVTVKESEEVEVFGKKQRLLRVEAVPDKVRAPQGAIQLPSMTSWLDKELLPVRSETDLQPLGKIVLYRANREVALAEGKAGPPSADIGTKSLVPLNRTLPDSFRTSGVVYRITVKGDDDPASTFARDERQTIENARGNTFELHVQAVRAPREKVSADKPKAEFLETCYYINSADARVKRFTQQAVGEETDPWKKAQRIERWVFQNVEHDNSVPFATADQIAEDPKGDCRHKAILSAAMCRAANVPSRTAVGLVYTDDRQRGPVMAFHMWTEVWVAGQWLAIDGTLGRGSIGADHIKIADSSWHDVESQTPLLPVQRVLGKMSIEVVRVEGAE